MTWQVILFSIAQSLLIAGGLWIIIRYIGGRYDPDYGGFWNNFQHPSFGALLLLVGFFSAIVGVTAALESGRGLLALFIGGEAVTVLIAMILIVRYSKRLRRWLRVGEVISD